MSNLEGFVLGSFAVALIVGPMLSQLMGLKRRHQGLDERHTIDPFDDPFAYNPATGLPMVGILDSAGNPWGSPHEVSAR
jgi:hypothetical protein